MKKQTLFLIVVIGLIAIIGLWLAKSYNTMVALQEEVTTKWANVESQYQRRSDLIPNLVATVKGYATHESETLEGVIAARSKATSITIDPSNCTPEQLAEYQKAQGELGSALGRLMAISENYPDLKANTNFLELQEQLEGTENRIQVSRREYNETVQVYNTKIRQFPGNIVASMFDFAQMNKFEADEVAKQAPKVEF